MSPEYVRHSSLFSTESDVFSLGAILPEKIVIGKKNADFYDCYKVYDWKSPTSRPGKYGKLLKLLLKSIIKNFRIIYKLYKNKVS